MFLFRRYLERYFENEVNMDHTKIYPEDLNSACRELSNGGLEIVVALSVFSGIFVCVFLLGVQSSCIPTGLEYICIQMLYKVTP